MKRGVCVVKTSLPCRLLFLDEAARLDARSIAARLSSANVWRCS
ncbi:hypothetical protein ACNKHQ_05445 [Shigella flexneri]